LRNPASAPWITPIPFSWDEITNKPEACRRALYELLGRQTAVPGAAFEELTLYEREVIHYAIWLNRPFGLQDMMTAIGKKEDYVRKVLREMKNKELVVPFTRGNQRIHRYILTEKARQDLI